MQHESELKDLLTQRGHGRHESFHLRTAWLRKGFDNIKNASNFFNNEKAVEELGVGKNMVNSIRYWCQAFKVIDSKTEGYEATAFGEYLFVHDKYLEDPISDWLLHYKLVTNYELAPSFFWAFNMMGLKEFNSDNFVKSISALYARLGLKTVPPHTLLSDFLVLVRTYCDRSNEHKGAEDVNDSPFNSLELMVPSQDKRNYRFRVGPKRDLSSVLIAFSIAKQMQYKSKNFANLNSFQINLDALLWEPFSPGMVFKLDGETLISYLEDICDSELLEKSQFSTSAGIKQLIVTCKNLNPDKILKDHYKAVPK